MIGLVLVAHGSLADSFREAMEHIVGEQPALATVPIAPDADIDHNYRLIKQAIDRVASSGGTIILTDMFGGTPSNLALSLMEKNIVEVIAGVNMPMLIKLAQIRQDVTIGEALRQAREAGQKYIRIASTLLNDSPD